MQSSVRMKTHTLSVLDAWPYAVWAAAIAIALSGCHPACDATDFDEADFTGRILFTERVTPHPGAFIRIEWSEDQFATPLTRWQQGFANEAGLLTFGYALCPSLGKPISVRAYEDLNGNQKLDLGEPNGRYDGTSDGNRGFIERTLPLRPQDEDDCVFFCQNQSRNDDSGNPPVRFGNLDIAIDSLEP